MESKQVRIDHGLTLRTITDGDMGFLYSCLAQRGPEVHVSSSGQLPSWIAHCRHWLSPIYAEKYIIMLDDLPAGYCYLSTNNEVGIHLIKECQHHGIGPKVVRHLCRTHPGVKLYANISPFNTRSQRMFEKLGWRELQRTYTFTQPNGEG